MVARPRQTLSFIYRRKTAAVSAAGGEVFCWPGDLATGRDPQNGLPKLRKNTGFLSSPGPGSSFKPISRRTGPIGEA